MHRATELLTSGTKFEPNQFHVLSSNYLQTEIYEGAQCSEKKVFIKHVRFSLYLTSILRCGRTQKNCNNNQDLQT